jgi:putative acetyltransferase
MSETLRAERPEDYAAIFALHAAAFPTDAEARLVDALRAGGWLTLGMIAERGGVVCGHVGFCRLAVVGADGARTRAVGLAPIAIAASERRKGVGGRLIEAAHRELIAASEPMSVVLGDPAFYGRFGYDAGVAARFSSVYTGPYLQAMALVGPLPASGEIVYPPPFAML